MLLPELFERVYFCQERRYDYLDFAQPVSENPAVTRMMAVAKELSVVIPVSFYERDGNCQYNSVAMIDADGSLLGVYRKTHIPDDHYYQEKFYFTPGNTGFRVFETRYGNVGCGICWDQWFSRAALRWHCWARTSSCIRPRTVPNQFLRPTASRTGASDARAGGGKHSARRCGQTASARIRLNHRWKTADRRAPSCFTLFLLTDETGEIIAGADRESECVLTARYDFARFRQIGAPGCVRDRRPETYDLLTR